MTLTSTYKSIVRAVTPIVLAAGVSILAKLGIKDPASITAISAGAGVAYTVVVRLIETKYPKFGRLLGFQNPNANPFADVNTQIDAAVAVIKQDAVKYAQAYAAKEVDALSRIVGISSSTASVAPVTVPVSTTSTVDITTASTTSTNPAPAATAPEASTAPVAPTVS